MYKKYKLNTGSSPIKLNLSVDSQNELRALPADISISDEVKIHTLLAENPHVFYYAILMHTDANGKRTVKDIQLYVLDIKPPTVFVRVYADNQITYLFANEQPLLTGSRAHEVICAKQEEIFRHLGLDLSRPVASIAALQKKFDEEVTSNKGRNPDADQFVEEIYAALKEALGRRIENQEQDFLLKIIASFMSISISQPEIVDKVLSGLSNELAQEAFSLGINSQAIVARIKNADIKAVINPSDLSHFFYETQMTLEKNAADNEQAKNLYALLMDIIYKKLEAHGINTKTSALIQILKKYHCHFPTVYKAKLERPTFDGASNLARSLLEAGFIFREAITAGNVDSAQHGFMTHLLQLYTMIRMYELGAFSSLMSEQGQSKVSFVGLVKLLVKNTGLQSSFVGCENLFDIVFEQRDKRDRFPISRNGVSMDCSLLIPNGFNIYLMTGAAANRWPMLTYVVLANEHVMPTQAYVTDFFERSEIEINFILPDGKVTKNFADLAREHQEALLVRYFVGASLEPCVVEDNWIKAIDLRTRIGSSLHVLFPPREKTKKTHEAESLNDPKSERSDFLQRRNSF